MQKETPNLSKIKTLEDKKKTKKKTNSPKHAERGITSFRETIIAQKAMEHSVEKEVGTGQAANTGVCIW